MVCVRTAPRLLPPCEPMLNWICRSISAVSFQNSMATQGYFFFFFGTFLFHSEHIQAIFFLSNLLIFLCHSNYLFYFWLENALLSIYCVFFQIFFTFKKNHRHEVDNCQINSVSYTYFFARMCIQYGKKRGRVENL